MAAKSRSATGVLIMALLWFFSFCGYIFFEAVVSLCIIYVCIKSLYGLCMYNFASEEALLTYERNMAEKSPVSLKNAFFIKLKNILLYLLFIIYFAGAALIAPNSLLKIFACAAFLLWTFDMSKSFVRCFRTGKYEGKWCFWDGVFEALMWIQNILSVFLAALKLITI